MTRVVHGTPTPGVMGGVKKLPKNKKLKGRGGDGPKGNGNGNTAQSLGNGMPRYYGGVGGYKGVDTKKIKRLVNGLIRDEVKDLRRGKAQIRRETRHEMQGARRDYRRGLGDLNHVFGESGDYINHLGQQNAQMFQGQADQTGAATAALQAQLGNSYTGAMDAGQAELGRLGIGQGGNFSGLIADQANAQAMAGVTGQNAQNTLGMMGGNAAGLMNLVSGMNQGSYMADMGKNLNNRNDLLTEARRGRQDQYNQVRDAIRDTRGSRRDLFLQMLDSLQQTGWSQYMDQQNLNMQKRAMRKG